MPPGDILIVAGDFTDTGTYEEIKSFYEFLKSNRHKYQKILVIPGNHEMTLHSENYLKYGQKFHKPLLDPEKAKEIIESYPDIEYLLDSSFEFKGLKFYGIPWVMPCGYWSFTMTNPNFEKSKMNEIPLDTDIIISHSPPCGILDEIKHSKLSRNKETGQLEMKYGIKNIGSPQLLERIKKIGPRVNIFGHIHENHGFKEKSGVLFVNASIQDEMHRPGNLPIVINLYY